MQGVYYELKIILSMDYIQHLKLLALAIPYSSSPMGTVDIIFNLGYTPLDKSHLVD